MSTHPHDTKFLAEQQARTNHRRLIMAAGYMDIKEIDALLRAGIDINSTQADSNLTALGNAIHKKNKLEVIKFLLDKKAALESDREDIEPPLITAIVSGNLEVVKLLIENKADIHKMGESGVNALEMAAIEPHPEIVQYLIDKGANAKQQAIKYPSLIHAVISMCKIPTAEGVQIRNSPEHIKKVIETINIFLKYGVDINTWEVFVPERTDYSNDGFTPLMLACDAGLLLPVVKFLVSKGAKVNQTAKADLTPLMSAIKTGSISVVEFLLEQRADVNHIDRFGLNAFRRAYAAIPCGEILSLLARYGAEAEINPIDLEFITSKGVRGPEYLKDEIMPLMARNHMYRAADVKAHFDVLENMADLFHYARTGQLKNKRKLLDLFLGGARINQRTADLKLNTPLHIVCENGDQKTLRALLGALTTAAPDRQIYFLSSAQNKARCTPLDVAAKHDNPNIALMLMDIIQPLIDATMMLLIQTPNLKRLPRDLQQSLFSFCCEGLFANQTEGAVLVEKMFDRAQANAEFLLGNRYYNGYKKEDEAALIKDVESNKLKEADSKTSKETGSHGTKEGDSKLSKEADSKSTNESRNNELIVDHKRAAIYFYRAAKRDHKEALFNLALCYKKGHGVKQSNRMAMICFSKAAKLGSGEAAFSAAILYQEGGGDLSQDLQKTLHYLRKGVELGSAKAVFVLALHYQQYYSDDRKLQDEALKLEQQATKLGLPIAHYKMGERYENGQGVLLDLRLAYQHYSFAAQNGIIEANARKTYCQQKIAWMKMLIDMPVQQELVQRNLTQSSSAISAEQKMSADQITQVFPPVVFRRVDLMAASVSANVEKQIILSNVKELANLLKLDEQTILSKIGRQN